MEYLSDGTIPAKAQASVENTTAEIPHLQIGYLTDIQIAQLIAYSRTDEIIKKFTSDADRFGSSEAVWEFLKEKQPFLVVLTDSMENLHGLVWFHKKPIPQDRNYTIPIEPERYPYTIAGRLYGEMRGHGQGSTFKKSAMQALFRSIGSEVGIWAETSSDNGANIRANTRIGFEVVSQPNKAGKIIMVRIPASSLQHN